LFFWNQRDVLHASAAEIGRTAFEAPIPIPKPQPQFGNKNGCHSGRSCVNVNLNCFTIGRSRDRVYEFGAAVGGGSLCFLPGIETSATISDPP